MQSLLIDEGVESAVVEGNVFRRNKAITAFSSTCKVILLGLTAAASGTNLTQATHVVLMDPMQGKAKEIRATEAQAIARAYRQGQAKEVTVVRLLIRATIEHKLFEEVYGKKDEEQKIVETPPLVRASSDLTQLLNAPELKRSGSFLRV
eukprot:TRINITY_DN12753_c0_g1_i3.p1 TRINITY_DN12753_c0_g1~~TRINITY_DN12753_c0_g1_i3.p1  ORF type:complete len:149 (-),score=38.81 TRINITY_DN12753_c0_g1_i3:137-583(-)